MTGNDWRIAVTGHRPERIGKYAETTMKAIDLFVATREDVKGYNVGGARGVDTWAGYAAWKHGKEFHLYLPFPIPIFTSRWTGELKSEISRLYKLKEAATSYRHFQEHYSHSGYWIRDKAMVDAANEVLAVWDGEEAGGTYITLQYARSLDRPITILNPKTGGFREENV